MCTRFAAELGRERVYQIAPDESSGRHAASREWRGKIAMDTDMVYGRLADLMQAGAAFVVEPVAEGTAQGSGDADWPVALIGAAGTFSLFSPEHDDAPSIGDLLVRLYQPALAPVAAAPRRRFRLPVRRAIA